MSERLRILITGAAGGVGAASARRFHQLGAHLVLADVDSEPLAAVAGDCGHAMAVLCDVRDNEAVQAAVEAACASLGGLDVVIAAAALAAQLPLVAGDPSVFERTIEVNLLGTYHALRAAAPHIAHERGYALATASVAAAVHPPLLGAYSASQAGVEALVDSLRMELRSSGARVGLAYFGGENSDINSRVNAVERAVLRRARRVVAPKWVAPVLPARMLAQRLAELRVRRHVDEALQLALERSAPAGPERPREYAARH